jgi:NosR/NirI family transcriptional regulator, nitrous oxide reductase regulator
MSTQHSPRSGRKSLLSIGLLICAIMFDGGSPMMGFVLHRAGLHPGIHAANKDHTSLRLLKEVVPGADSFSEKEGEVPVYKAYRTDPANGAKTLIGYAFVTADTLPEPSGFSGPIDSLVGMDLEGNIVGLRVVYYKESLRYTWGDFLEFPGVQEQYIGKRAADRFLLGKDVDGISKATISSRAMATGVRRSIRAVTQAYLP